MAELKERTIEKEFVSYEIALELKELGFEEPCFGNIDQIGCIHVKGSKSSPRGSMMYNTIDCPIFSQAFRFFREQLLLDSCIIPYWFIDGEYKVKKYTYSIEPSNRFDEYFDCDSDEYDTYKEAEIACLVKLIEICRKLK